MSQIGTSCVGVKNLIYTSYSFLSEENINEVSELFISLAIFCICTFVNPSAFVTTPARLPVNFSFVNASIISYTYLLLLNFQLISP